MLCNSFETTGNNIIHANDLLLDFNRKLQSSGQFSIISSGTIQLNRKE